MCVSDNNFLSCTFWLANFKCGVSFCAPDRAHKKALMSEDFFFGHSGAISSPAGWEKLYSLSPLSIRPSLGISGRAMAVPVFAALFSIPPPETPDKQNQLILRLAFLNF